MKISDDQCLKEQIESASSDQLQELDRILQDLELRQSSDGPTPYEEHADAALEREREVVERAQEIGPLPLIKDPLRRERCRYDLRLFFMTYFPMSCWRGLSGYQNEMLSAFQQVILNGGKKARAVRRGGLKSTCARVAVAWAISYRHRRFPVLVGATDDKSNEHRDNLFSMLASSAEYLADFPEIGPLLAKRKNPKRQFRLNGELLSMSAKDERGCIIFPRIDGAGFSESRIAPYSMQSTDVSGLSFIDSSGATIRPDLLIFDDVQTPQSAKSHSMTASREDAITTTFMGLAGLGETIAAVMVCTVRQEGDLTIRFCDRDRHPDWDGRTFPVLISEPKSKLWSKYGELLRDGETPEKGFALASALYAEHRAEMDEGGKVAWEDDKEKGYLTALQWCMTVKFLQPDFFRSELQQQGSAPPGTVSQLVERELLSRLSHIKRGVIPDKASCVTAFVDSSDHILWWMICAWKWDFSGWIVDFGTWPDQQRTLFYKSDIPRPIESQFPGISWEQAFVRAHNQLDEFLLGRSFPTESGKQRRVDLLLKDWSDGDHKRLIEAQVSASKYKSIIRPSKGFAPKPGKKPVHFWGDKQDRHTKNHWVERRTEHPFHVQFDANRWKRHIVERLRTEIGAPSSLLLPGSDDRDLALIGEHFTAERAVSIKWGDDDGIAFEEIPNRDNDQFDCVTGNAVAASMLGVQLPEISRPIPANRRHRKTVKATPINL